VQVEKEIKIVEREDFNGGNFKVIKQFIMLEWYLHFSGHSVGFPRYSGIAPVTLTFFPVTLSGAKSLYLNGNATKTPHLYYGFYYVENFFQNFFKNSSRIVKLFVEFSVYCIEVQKFNEKFG